MKRLVIFVALVVGHQSQVHAQAGGTPERLARFLVDYPVRIRVGGNLGDEMGKGELELRIRGDSAFGTWRPTEPARRSAQQLVGTVRHDTVFLSVERKGSISVDPQQSFSARMNWVITDWGENFKALFTVDLPIGGLETPTRTLTGKRIGPP